MYHYRVFISYTHEDRDLARTLASELEHMGMHPVWDREIAAGCRFNDAIREGIASAHIFMPLITAKSQHRPWVHQETGFAMGVGVPILPIAVSTVPGEMIAELQAISVEPDLSDLQARLQASDLEQVVLGPTPKPFTGTLVADQPEERTLWMIEYANWLIKKGTYGRLRQRAIFSSLSIPDREPGDPIWDRFDGPNRKSTMFRQRLREERIALEEHARREGCTLLIAPFIDFGGVGPDVHRVQLQTLVACLESLPTDIDIAFSSHVDEGNVTAIGDWFVVYSHMPRTGLQLRQSIFSTHAPTVLKWVLMLGRQAEEGRPTASSREEAVRAALEQLRQRIDSLPT